MTKLFQKVGQRQLGAIETKGLDERVSENGHTHGLPGHTHEEPKGRQEPYHPAIEKWGFSRIEWRLRVE